MFTKGAKITGNKVYDSYSIGIYLDNAQDAVVQYNTVSHSYDTAFYRSGKPATGIVICERERRPHAAVVGHRDHRQRAGRRRQSGLQQLWRQHGLGELDDLP